MSVESFKSTVIKKISKSQKRYLKESKFWNKYKETHSSLFKGIVSQLYFSPDEPFELFTVNSYQVKIFSCQEEFKIRRLEALKNQIYCLNLSICGKMALLGGTDRLVHLVAAKKRMKIKKFIGHNSTIRDVCFGPDKSVLSVDDKGTWRFWDIPTSKQIQSNQQHKDSIRSCKWFSEKLFITGSFDHNIKIWDIRIGGKKQCVKNYHMKEHVLRVLALKNRFVASCGSNIFVFDLRNKNALYEIKMHRKGVMGLASNHDATRLFSAGLDQYVKIFETEKFELIYQMNMNDPVMDVKISNNGKFLACGLTTGKVIIKSFKGNLNKSNIKCYEKKSQILFKNQQLKYNLKPGTKKWFIRGFNSEPNYGQKIFYNKKKKKFLNKIKC